MKSKIFIMIMIFTVIFSFGVYAGEAEDILALALEKQNYDTLQADVTVEMGIPHSNKTMTQKYKYLYKSPGKTRMEIFSPLRQTVIVNEEMISVKMADGSVKKINKLDMPGVDSINVIKDWNIENILNQYKISLADEYNFNDMQCIDIRLLSKNNSYLYSITLGIEKETKKIIKVMTADDKGNTKSLNIYEEIKVIDGVYFPSSIKGKINNHDGQKLSTIQVKIDYRNIVINSNIDESEFKLQ